MKYKEFLEYLETNLTEYSTFREKALTYQKEKNAKRPKAKQWDNKKLDKAVYGMWQASMQTLYDNLKRQIDSNFAPDWIAYIANHEILQITNEGISEMSFEE